MSQQTRLPSTGAPRNRAVEVLAGLVALIGAVVVVVGVPVGLWLVAGAPWAPSVDESILSDNVSARDTIVVIAIVLWVVWAYFCACLLVEAVAEARGSRIAPQLLGGGGGTQALARRIVAGVVLIGGTTASTVAATHAITMPTDTGLSQKALPQLPSGAGAAATPSHPGPERGFVPVEQRDTDGVVYYYDVKPPEGRHYETMWDIAERFLGNGLRYKEIFALNKGVVQPDGRTLSDADLIQPGWVLRLPADAQGTELRVVDHSGESLDEVPEATVAAPVAEDGADGVATTPVGAVLEPAPASEEPSAGAQASGWTPLFGVAGGMLAAGLAAGLRRYRASASIGGLVGRRLDPPPDGSTSSPEAALRNEADPGAGRMLSRGLRSWTSGVLDSVPPIAQCSVSATGIAVSFHGTPSVLPPNGWRSERDGRIWTIAREDTDSLGESSISPAPGLVAFGAREDGSTLLKDLDAFSGLVSIGGDPHRARATAMSFALDTATHAWGDRRQVTMVGFADDVTAVSAGSIRVVDDLQRAIQSAERVADEQRHACGRLGVRTVHEARFSRPDATLWQHHLVVCSGVPSADSLARLHDLAADVCASVAVVVVGDVPTAAARLVASADGRLTSQPLGVDVRAQAIDIDAYRGIVDVYQRSTDVDVDPDGPDEIGHSVDITDVEPSLLDADTSQPLEIRVLGSVEVEAPGEIDEARRDLLTEIVVFTAMQRGGVHPNTLAAAIWPRGVEARTRDEELVRVRAWLGEERFVFVDGLWELVGPGTRIDWDIFRAYLDHAEQMPREATYALTAALDLVGGEAWADLPTGRYGWLAYTPAQVEIPALVVRTACRLAETHADQGNADAARDALLRGLRMAPASEQLWCAALRLAQKFATPRDVKTIADQMYAAVDRLGSPRGARPETDALVEELLPGYRHDAA
ncbi:MAG: hypothetical protein ACRDO7_12155 [Nocardioidaceae bacterium]